MDALLSRLSSAGTSQNELLPKTRPSPHGSITKRLNASQCQTHRHISEFGLWNALRRQRWDSELRTLFKKIDAGCSETVTWEESW